MMVKIFLCMTFLSVFRQASLEKARIGIEFHIFSSYTVILEDTKSHGFFILLRALPKVMNL